MEDESFEALDKFVREKCLTNWAWIVVGCGYYDEDRTPLIVADTEEKAVSWANKNLLIDDNGRFYDYYNENGDLLGTYDHWVVKRIEKV